MSKEKERILIEMTSEEQLELWDGVYYMGNSYEINGETYTSVDKINTSDYSDGPSWNYIVRRESDGLYFKFHIWEAGGNNGYLCQGKGLKQVFEITKVTYE